LPRELGRGKERDPRILNARGTYQTGEEGRDVFGGSEEGKGGECAKTMAVLKRTGNENQEKSFSEIRKDY